MTDRQSLSVKLAKILQKFPLSVFRFLEWPILRTGNKDQEPPLLIVLALPRSGSTLTYQALIHSFKCVYLSNLWHLLYKLPLLGGLLAVITCREHKSDFKSQNGFTNGLCGPAEGLHFWTYWFDNNIDERSRPKSANLSSKVKYLKKVLAFLSNKERPVVTGYIGHVLCVKRLRKEFPKAIFIRLYRDPLANALSLLKCRHSSPEDWFSVFPSECKEYEEGNVYQQVAAQVYWLNKRVDENIGNTPTIHLRYEDLCEAPNFEMEKIIDFLKEEGIDLQPKNSRLPNGFTRTKVEKNKDSKHLEKLKEAFSHLEKRFGRLDIPSKYYNF